MKNPKYIGLLEFLSENQFTQCYVKNLEQLVADVSVLKIRASTRRDGPLKSGEHFVRERRSGGSLFVMVATEVPAEVT